MAEKNPNDYGETIEGDKVRGIKVEGDIIFGGSISGSQINIGQDSSSKVNIGGDFVSGDKIGIGSVIGKGGVFAGREAKEVQPGLRSSNLPQLQEDLHGLSNLRANLFDLVLVFAGKQQFKIAITGPAGSGKTAVATELAHKMQNSEIDGLSVLWAALGPQQNARDILRQWVRDTSQGVLTEGRQAHLSLPEPRSALQINIESRPLIVVLDNARSAAEAQALQVMPENTIYIMTTRDQEVAAVWADLVLETGPLAPDEGLSLLIDHYITDDDLISELADIEAVVAHTDGSPLTLRVMGQFLTGQTEHTNPMGINLFTEGYDEDSVITLETVVSSILDSARDFREALIALGAFAADPADFFLQSTSKICDVSGNRLLRREFFGLARFENSKVIIDKALSNILRKQLGEISFDAQRRHAQYYLSEVLISGNDPQGFENIYDQVLWAWQQTEDLVLLSQLIEACEPLQRERGLEDDSISWLERFVDLAHEKNLTEFLGISLIRLGDAYVGRLQFEEAIGRYKRVIEELPEQVDTQLRAETLYKIGDAYRRLDQADRSLKYFSATLSLLQESGADPALEAATSVDVGLIYDQFGQTEQSLLHFQAALALLQEIGDEKAIATTLHNIAAALDNQGRREEALDYYQQALEVRRRLSDMPGIANTLNNMGVLYRGRGQFDLAIRNYAEALSIRESIGDRGGAAVILHNMGLAYQESGEYEHALSQFEQAERGMRAVSDRAGLAATLDNKGRICTQLNRMEQAKKAYEEALAIKESLSDPVGLATTHRYLGDALVVLGHYEEAEGHYKKAVELAASAGAQKLLGRALEKMAALYDLEDQEDSATGIYEDALEAMYRAGFLEGQSKLNIVLGERYAERKRYDEAQSHFDEARRIAAQTEDWESVIAILEQSAQTYFAAEDIERTLAAYNKIIAIISEKKLDRVKCAETYLTMGTIAKEHGKLPEAVSFWQRSRDIYIELNNPAAKSVESLLDELQAVHSDLFDFPALVMRFFEAAGFDIEEHEDWAILTPTHRSWRPYKLNKRIPYWLSLGEPLKADRVNHIYEKSKEAEPGCRQIFVVIDKTPADDGWLAIATLRAQDIGVLPVTQTVIYEGQADRQQRSELRGQIDQMLGHHNLYEVSTPISDPLNFFGREAFANQLVEQLDNGHPVILFGLRKMGKSSLLYFLRDRLPFPTAYVDAQASTDAFSIFGRALDKWQESLRVKAPNVAWDRPDLNNDNLPASFAAAVKDLLDVLDEQGTHDRLCLMIDELEVIHPANKQSSIQNYMNIARTLRGLVQEYRGQFYLVGAAVDPFFNRSSRTDGLQNPFFKFFQEKYLQPLEPEHCVQMIRSIGRQMGIEYEEEAAELIAEVSGGHPLIARQLAGLIHEQNKDREQITVEQIRNGIELFLKDMKRVDLVGKNGLWAEVSDPAVWTEEQANLNISMLSSLAEEQPQPYDELRGQTSIQTTDYSLYELSQRAVLNKEEQEEYAIRLLLFRKWIRRNILQLQD